MLQKIPVGGGFVHFRIYTQLHPVYLRFPLTGSGDKPGADRRCPGVAPQVLPGGALDAPGVCQSCTRSVPKRLATASLGVPKTLPGGALDSPAARWSGAKLAAAHAARVSERAEPPPRGGSARRRSPRALTRSGGFLVLCVLRCASLL